MSLTPKQTRLIELALAITQHDAVRLRELRLSAPPGEPDREWREALLQTHLFAGFPSVVEALRILQQVGGLGPPTADEAVLEPDDFGRGQKLFDAIYGTNAGAVQKGIAAGHPLFERWILGHAYGRVLARGGMAPSLRELLAVACLSAQGLERQLASHVRGALDLGASTDEVRATLACLAGRIEPDRLARARAVVERFGR